MSLKTRIKRLLKGFPGEKKYWNDRYKKGGNSGPGSYGRLSEYKATILNSFIKKNHIKSIIDFGCGDGNQTSLLKLKETTYLGLDISDEALTLSKKKFMGQDNYSFKSYTEYVKGDPQANLSISLDVLFHIVSDKLYHQYLGALFSSSNNHVIIYSRDTMMEDKFHVCDREFLKDIERDFPEWHLKRKETNPYVFDSKDPENTSRSHFFFFEREGNIDG